VSDNEMRAAGYLDSAATDATLPAAAAGMLWASEGRNATDPARFHVPVRAMDAFGNVLRLDHDRYGLALTRTEDAVANVMTGVIDYRNLKPVLVTDPNGNTGAVALDALGFVVATAVAGKAGEGDALAVFPLETSTSEVDAFFR
jgi:hypothetical protein